MKTFCFNKDLGTDWGFGLFGLRGQEQNFEFVYKCLIGFCGDSHNRWIDILWMSILIWEKPYEQE